MNMDIGRSLSHRPHNIEIGLSGVIRMDTTLQTDLGGTQRRRFLDSSVKFCRVNIVSSACNFYIAAPFRKSTKPTAVLTDIGVIDVAVHHISDLVTHLRLAQRICRRTHRINLCTARRKQRQHGIVVHCFTPQAGCDRLSNRR